ncbi:Flavodoxin domain-domain-containing protein [Clohesyomyces aquaticus]|uniref:Flavodoxin domain-domain-containing protein n=1 Tax=Clohesyomyces aquaticus TaxID=1231657 RepID=A0A1Y1YZ18_9PLEO|nr:Flavodoxin domain-domain-containing protein [Clohesyomyces aquaticus]
MPILILYASEHGTTAEIAERLSSRIASQLPPTEVHALSDIDPTTLPNYTAIILGSAIHGAAWLPKATNFLTANKNALLQKPLFVFSVGAPDAMPKLLRGWWKRMEERKIKEKVEKVLGTKVKGEALFGGKLDEGEVGGCVSCCCGMFGGRTVGDFRKWEEVEAWADEVVGVLKKPAEGEGEGVEGESQRGLAD